MTFRFRLSKKKESVVENFFESHKPFIMDIRRARPPGRALHSYRGYVSFPDLSEIDHIPRLSGQKSADVFGGDVNDPLAGFPLGPGHVGGYDAVGGTQQGIVG